MARKVLALIASERSKTCDHAGGFPFRGRMPCTGPRVCTMCGSNVLDVCKVCPLTLHEHADTTVDHAFVNGREG